MSPDYQTESENTTQFSTPKPTIFTDFATDLMREQVEAWGRADSEPFGPISNHPRHCPSCKQPIEYICYRRRIVAIDVIRNSRDLPIADLLSTHSCKGRQDAAFVEEDGGSR